MSSSSPLFDRVLILGGGGMLAHAFKSLLSQRGVTPIAPPRAQLDICDRPCLERTFAEVNPTVVLNCSAHTKVDLCDYQRDLALAINATGPGNAARIAADKGIPFVHFSTDFVFSGTPEPRRPWKETDPTLPASFYGESKLQGEKAVAANHPSALIFRTSWLFGPGGPCFPQTMLNFARQGKPLSVVSDQFGSPTMTFDLARTTLELLEKKASGLFHLSNAGETTWFDFTAEILKTFNTPTTLTSLTSAEWKAKVPWSATRPSYSTLDCSKANSLLTTPIQPWQQALQEYKSLISNT